MTRGNGVSQAATSGALMVLVLLASGSAVAQPAIEESRPAAVSTAQPDAHPAAAEPAAAVSEGAGVVRADTTVPAVVDATRYPLPWQGVAVRHLALAPDGKVWFSDGSSTSLASFDAEARRFERIQLLGLDAEPGDLLIDARGRLWLTASDIDYVGVLDPGAERLHKITLTRYPGLAVGLLAGGDEGTVWFSAADRPALGLLRGAAARDSEARDGGASAGAADEGAGLELRPLTGLSGQPTALVVADDGAVWLGESGSNRVLRHDPQSGALSTFLLPFAEARADQLLALGNRIAVVDNRRQTLGLLDPGSGAYLEYPVPIDGAPLAVSDGQQSVWLVSPGHNARLTSFDASTRRFSTPVALAVPVADAALAYDRRGAALWLAGEGELVQLPLSNLPQ